MHNLLRVIKKTFFNVLLGIIASSSSFYSRAMIPPRSAHPIIEILKDQFKQTIITMPLYFELARASHTVLENHPSLESIIQDRYAVMKSDFNNALELFKETYDYGEMALQNIIDLLTVELRVVHNLLIGTTGATQERAVDKRNARLEMSTPSVVYIYNKVIDLVMNSQLLNEEIYRGCACKKQLVNSLNGYNQRLFLKHVEQKLRQYRKHIYEMQYDISIASGEMRDLSNENGYCPNIT